MIIWHDSQPIKSHVPSYYYIHIYFFCNQSYPIFLHRVEHPRVVLRKGHIGVSFYFIFSGSVFVNVEELLTKTGHVMWHTAITLNRGDSFGVMTSKFLVAFTFSKRKPCHMCTSACHVRTSYCMRASFGVTCARRITCARGVTCAHRVTCGVVLHAQVVSRVHVT